MEDFEQYIRLFFNFIVNLWFIALALYIIYLMNKKKPQNSPKQNKKLKSRDSFIQQITQQIENEKQKQHLAQQSTTLMFDTEVKRNYETNITLERPAQEGTNYEAKLKTEKKTKKKLTSTPTEEVFAETSETDYWQKLPLQSLDDKQESTQKETNTAHNQYVRMLRDPQTLQNMFIATEIFKKKF
ncbi:MAG: hypothetical protein NZ551_11820 [Microscillaceae bacterium]|nr:hypothetical protein [Microscillaceae bacterium]MDW8461882.1 hypothetical protein [Cytophagales bacterium]